jgi:murein DD-endopeptidase MepM/ murein hydrolase activator NlpD
MLSIFLSFRSLRTSWLASLVVVWLGSLASSGFGDASQAQSIEREGLGLPLLCTLGETCWVANYVDVDPTEAARDFRCRPRTYNTHDGTDFAIRDLAVMAQGVPVVASAAGMVRNVRDGMEDVGITDKAARTQIAGRNCGNGVLIEHEAGWQTQYCHLRRGSLRVKPGERVNRGSPLGLVGLSGKTEFPHVHLTLRRNGEVIDPFTGQPMRAGCGLSGTPLWRVEPPVAYEEAALYNAGLSGGQPNLEAIRSGRRDEQLAPTSPALVLWVEIFGVQAGDWLRFRVTGPDGALLLEQEVPIERTQAWRFAFAGTHVRTGTWPLGVYTGTVTLMRRLDGRPMERSVTRTVTMR